MNDYSRYRRECMPCEMWEVAGRMADALRRSLSELKIASQRNHAGGVSVKHNPDKRRQYQRDWSRRKRAALALSEGREYHPRPDLESKRDELFHIKTKCGSWRKCFDCKNGDCIMG